MTTIQVYRNRRNSNKYIEVHNDGHYHNSLKQYLYWERNVITGEPLPEPVKNITGEQRKHSRRKEDTTRHYISRQGTASQFRSLKASSER